MLLFNVMLSYECNLSILSVMVKSRPTICAAKHWNGLQILSSYNRAMGRFSDVVCCDLANTDIMGMLLSYVIIYARRGRLIPHVNQGVPGAIMRTYAKKCINYTPLGLRRVDRQGNNI